MCFHRWLDNNGSDSAVGSRRNSVSDPNLTSNYTLTKRPRVMGAQDSHQGLFEQLSHCLKFPTAEAKLKIKRKANVVAKNEEISFFKIQSKEGFF